MSTYPPNLLKGKEKEEWYKLQKNPIIDRRYCVCSGQGPPLYEKLDVCILTANAILELHVYCVKFCITLSRHTFFGGGGPLFGIHQAHCNAFAPHVLQISNTTYRKEKKGNDQTNKNPADSAGHYWMRNENVSNLSDKPTLANQRADNAEQIWILSGFLGKRPNLHRSTRSLWVPLKTTIYISTKYF